MSADTKKLNEYKTSGESQNKCLTCDMELGAFEDFCSSMCQRTYEKHQYKQESTKKGRKHDNGKKRYYSLPLSLLGPLASVFEAGEKKYSIFNCLEPFEDSDARFWDAMMRHLVECQIDPLARDEETGCYHAAQAAFNVLLRIHNAERRK